MSGTKLIRTLCAAALVLGLGTGTAWAQPVTDTAVITYEVVSVTQINLNGAASLQIVAGTPGAGLPDVTASTVTYDITNNAGTNSKKLVGKIDTAMPTATTLARYAVQVVTHVGETGECRLAFNNPRIQPGSLTVDVKGGGSRACRPSLKLEIFNADGTLQHTATMPGSYLYPATSARQTFNLVPLAPGSYSFLLLADVGADTLQGARFQIQVR